MRTENPNDTARPEAGTTPQGMTRLLRPLRRLSRSRSIELAICCVVAFAFTARVLYAINVVTDGTMELNPLVNWTTSGSVTATADGTYKSSGNSLKGLSTVGKNKPYTWQHQQNIGSIASGSTVNLSYWYGYLAVLANPSVATTITVDISKDGGAWTTLSTRTFTPALTFASATVAAADVSSSFVTGCTTCSIRLNVSATTGNNNNAQVAVYWDDVVLDVAAPPISTTIGDGTDPSSTSVCPGTGAIVADAFTLTSTRNSVITGVTVNLGTGAAAGVASVSITNDTQTLTYGTLTSPASDTVTIPLTTNITSTTTATPYDIVITPISHAGAVGTFVVAAKATGLTSDAVTVTANDVGDATITVDNAPPSAPTWGTNAAGDSSVALSWNNPPSDFAEVVILRKEGTAIADAPVDGSVYLPGATINTSTVVYAGSATSWTDTSALNGSTYYYKIFARDACSSYSAGTQSAALSPVAVTTTVGDGTNPSPATLCPGDAANELDAFTLKTNTATATVSGVTVSLASGTATALSSIEITNDAGSTVYGTLGNPPADVATVTLTTNITATTTQTQYKVRITPKTDLGMPANAATPYAVTGTVTAITASGQKAYSDTGSATITIDNSAPSAPTWGTNTPADSYVDLAWTNPVSDFAGVVILRSTAAISDAPVEGVTYAQGNTINASSVVYAGNLAAYRDNSAVNGTTYYYKIFAHDGCFNYSAGTQSTALQPVANAGATTIGDGSGQANATLCPGDAATNIDSFTVQNTVGSVALNSVTITFAPGTVAALSLIEVTNDAGTVVYGSLTNPAVDAPTVVLGTAISSTTTLTQYRIRVTPRTAIAMPGNVASPYAITARVTAATSTPDNAKTYSDTTSATVTIDNSSPAAPSWGANMANDSQIGLAWTNPSLDFSAVVILRNTSVIADAPAEGVTYVAGNTIGASAVVYAGSGTSFTDTSVTNGTTYYYKIFAKDSCGNYSTGMLSGALTPAMFVGDMTVGDGVNPGSAAVCPGAGPTMVDAFTLRNASGSVQVTGVTTTLSSGAAAVLSKIEITNDDGSVVYGAWNNPAGDIVTITLASNIAVTTTTVQYKVRVTPKTHAAMPANAASPYMVSATVTGVASTNLKVYSDSSSATIVVDNSAPDAATWSGAEVADSQLMLWWSAPGADQVVILRSTSATATDTPVEGNSYTAGQSIGTSAVRYVGNGGSFTDTGLTNGTMYYYRIFTRDGCGNYSAAVQSSGYRPNVNVPKVTPGSASYTASACDSVAAKLPVTVSVTFIGDTPATGSPNSNTKFYLIQGSISGTPVETCDRNTPSPRTCSMSLDLNKTYYVKVKFFDPDGVGGPAEQVVGPIQTPVQCQSSATTALTATANRSTCNQIDVYAPLSGDGNANGSVKVEYNTTNTWPGLSGGCATLVGASPRVCRLTSLTGAQEYYVRVTYTDPDTVVGTATQTLGPVAAKTCGADAVPPMATFLSPARHAVIGGAERVKVQLYDNVQLAASPLTWLVDATTGTWSATSVTKSTNYSNAICGRSDDPRCAVYEFDLPAFVANGDHYIALQVSDAAGNAGIVTQPVVVKGTTKALGLGKLLRRTNSSQLCIDCHTYKGHSSQTANSTQYGNWGLECLDCHTPHGTTNIGLIRNVIETPSSGFKAVEFRFVDKVGDTEPDYGHLGASAVLGDGLCEACHTKTTVFTNSAATTNHYPGARCTNCHGHTSGFKAEACNDCHNAPPATGPHRKHDEVWNSTAGNLPSSYGDNTNHGSATQYGYACNNCHAGTHKNDATVNPTHNGTVANPWLVEVTFRDGNIIAPYNGTYAGTYKQAIDQPGSIAFSTSSGTCSNTYCHSNANPLGGTNLSTAAAWTGATTCASCHKTGANGDAGFDATGLSRSHNRHIQSASGETGTYTFKCADCHTAVMNAIGTNPWALTTADLKNKMLHVNENKQDVNFASIGAANQSAGAYAGAGRTCSGTYCHSQGISTTTFTAPNENVAWNGSTTCVSCHNGNAVRVGFVMATGMHTQHVSSAATYGNNVGCASCHSSTVSADESISSYAAHVNGAREVTGTNAGTWGGTATPTCTGSKCHSSGEWRQASEFYNLNWQSGPAITDCKGCHGKVTSPAFTSQFGEPNYSSAGTTRYNSHQKHVTASTDCSFCHNSTVGTSNKIDGSNPAKHMDFDGIPDITFKTGYSSGTYNYATTRTCTNNYCHSQGTPAFTAANYPNVAWGVASTAPTSCVLCHNGNSARTGNVMATGKHGQHVNIAATYGNNVGCVQCHNATLSADEAISTPAKHMNLLREVAGTYAGTWGGTATPTCNGSRCHSSGEWRQTPAYYQVDWTAASAFTCKSCHGNITVAPAFTSQFGEPNYANAGTTRYNSHQKHVISATDCTNCHSSTVGTSNKIDGTNPAKHMDFDNIPDITFKATWGGTYDYASARTCTNNHCHSKGTVTYAAPNTAVAWGGTTVTCASCHGGNIASTSAIATPGHAAHINNIPTMGYNLACVSCHSTTVATDTTFASGVTMFGHIDKARPVAGTNIGTWNGTTCTGSRCHSNGQRQGTQEYYAVTWATETITDCKGCHGRSTTPLFTSVAGEPNYATNAPSLRYNSHKAHVGSALDCKSCHASTVGTSNKIDGTTPTKHMDFDGVPDITFAAPYAGTYNPTSRACTVGCHGSGAPVWGGAAMVCGDCHLSTAADVDSWNINDAVVSNINSTEWTSTGHGSATVALPAGNQCLYCHTASPTSAHYDAANPFRLANTAGADGPNGACLICHKTASAGYNPGTGLKNGAKKINSYHYGTKHGTTNTGGRVCWDCHDPHGDGNIKMVGKTAVKTSNDAWSLSATRTTQVTFTSNATGGGYVSQGAAITATGVCNVCHGTAGHYKSTSGDGHNSGTVCTTCHAHSQAAATDAFKNAGGGNCIGCHGDASGAPARRATNADFADGTTPNFRSHHVGNGTANALKGTLTNFDCVVCHAEGKVTAGATDTTGQPHMDGKIDLRNVDSATAYFTYDKDAIKASAGTNLAQWSSANAVWRTQTSTALDPFCLSCHDSNGATAITSFGEAAASATNPFADTAIANNYDQLVRPGPIDVKTKVMTGVTMYSRHAIRGTGMAPSVYTKYTGALTGCAAGVTPCQPIYDFGFFVQNGTDENGKPNWNDTSVMGCADCHTSDGANGTTGNAHGSTSEYLLKDGAGGATEGTMAGNSYVCYRCHTTAAYSTAGTHANNGGDYQDYTGQVGANRVPVGNTGGSRFGMACTNCHGGGPSHSTATPGTDGFGWIHGTNQTFYVGYTTTTRNAYRFMNGGSMRFWDPNGWNTGSGTCYTLGGTGRAADQWGGCIKHSGGGAYTRKVFRPLTY